MRVVTRLPVICGVVLWLSACMLPRVLPPLDSAPRLTEPPAPGDPLTAHGPLDFNWRLEGYPTAAPLQVFSSQIGVWLHFAEIDHLPAIFGVAPDGAERLLTFRRQAPYVYLAGPWAALRFRAGHRMALAQRVPQHVAKRSSSLAQAVQPSAVGEATSGQNTHVSRTAAAPSIEYSVSPEDGNLRRALRRWAHSAGWTFEAEHWTLAADIPITAGANLGSDFHRAVSALLASTEMADLPVQPCFYQNRVLRVIAYAQRCYPRGDAPGAPTSARHAQGRALGRTPS